jgi:hypothetical protein
VAIPLKKCKICKESFTPYNSLAVACSPKCALEVAVQKKNKKQKKELLAFRQADKNIPKLRAEAQKAVNAYIRLRDFDLPCISCGEISGEGDYLKGSKYDAGHYRARGGLGKHLAYNCFNIHKQCVYCNRSLSGNIVEYRKGLIERIGIERVERLESDNGYRKFDRVYLERIKKIFNKRVRHLKKLRDIT